MSLPIDRPIDKIDLEPKILIAATVQTATRIQTALLATHGMLALLFGLALLYLHTVAVHEFFGIFAASAAILLGIAAFLMAGLADFMAAFVSSRKKAHHGTFLLVSAAFFVTAATSLVLYQGDSIRLLLLISALLAVTRGGWSLFLAARTWTTGPHPILAASVGLLSFGFAGMLLSARSESVQDALAVLAVYTCFVGALLLFYAQQLRAAQPPLKALL